MNGKDLFLGMNHVNAKFVDEAETVTKLKGEKKIHSFRRPVLIAAIIGILMLLAGCAAYLLSLEQLVVVDHTNEVVEEDKAVTTSTEILSEATTDPLVVEKVLSIHGYEGSPSYNALQEWLTYVTDYMTRNPEVRISDDFQRPEAYTKYPCYSQEMVDKVDEICSKYGLHLLGKSLFIVDAEGMAVNGLSGVLYEDVTPRCFYGHLYQDGSFVASGELEFTGDYEKTVQFQMHNIKKDAFYTVHLGLNNISDYVQWNYTTLDGYNALLAQNDKTGLIIAENEGRYISIIIDEVPDSGMDFTGLPNERQFLEMVCDCFVFTDLESK